MPEIIFTDITETVPSQFYPKPAKNFIPNWIKHLPPYIKDTGSMTGKKCIPMLDAVMSGYMIVITDDLKISKGEDGFTSYEWKDGLGIEFHDAKQLETNQKAGGKNIPKWVSPWSIETPKGYSCLFVAPLNSDPIPFEVFSGVVDTDSYFFPVSFPFTLKDDNFTGIVPAGTPIAQVFPFKRESWKSRFATKTTSKIRQSYRIISGSYRNGYKKYLRKQKSFE